jgi:hypothetical protein
LKWRLKGLRRWPRSLPQSSVGQSKDNNQGYERQQAQQTPCNIIQYAFHFKPPFHSQHLAFMGEPCHYSAAQRPAVQPHAERAQRAKRVGWKRMLGGFY